MSAHTTPVPLPPLWQAIPTKLTGAPGWVAWAYQWRKGKWTKAPRTAAGTFASTTDPTTWATFATVQAVVTAGRADGVGIVLTNDLVGIDLDHVRNPTGELEPWAREIVQRFAACYIERSPGGDGLRIFCRGKAPRSGKGGPENRLEVYDRDSPRYLTVTGHAVVSKGAIAEGEVIEAQAAIDWLHERYMTKGAPVDHAPTAAVSRPMTDAEVLRLARAARNGPKFAALFDNGEGGTDASSNDAALLAMLCFYTQAPPQLDRLMRESALMRPKWDSRRGNQTYGALSIAKVLAMPGERYRPAGAVTRPYGAGRFEVSDARGVVYVGTDKDGADMPPLWLCSRVDVMASTRDGAGNEWGRLLQWHDDDGRAHTWAMPSELLQGDGADVRRELARQGVRIAPSHKGRDTLIAYLSTPDDARARCVDRLGWHGSMFVTPGEAIGEANTERVVFQNPATLPLGYSVADTVEDWRASVGALAMGNTRLVFAISAAFAGPLADLADEAGGGFHLRGGTSTGKTTALSLAASVWGDPKTFIRLWRATANGLEGLAALHNDGLLILDELSQVDPKEAGEAAYMLANGQGKARASRSGAARPSARWRVLFLSSGEVSLAALMGQAGKRANAGQDVRLADIDADAGAGMGVFEDLHGHATPNRFALALRDATRAHGAVGMQWLRCLVRERAAFTDSVARDLVRFMSDVVPTGAAGAVARVARRFALVAVAGELASTCGLTGWPAGESQRAARACFASWLQGFGVEGSREDRALLSQVRGFFETHGASRFEDMGVAFDQRIVNRAGFYRAGADGAREFLVLPEAFKRDVCAGFDATAGAKTLLAHGWLKPGSNGKASRTERLPGMGDKSRAYVFTSKLWEYGT